MPIDPQRSFSPRARNLVELEALYAKVFEQEAWRRPPDLAVEDSDVFVSPYPKCGTTLLQQIAHALRCRGETDFDEISSVVPWIEAAGALNAPQPGSPRLFKSHADWHRVPKGGKYVCSFRHPFDAAVSFYRFHEGWFFEAGAISIEDFTRRRWSRDQAGRRGYWHHLGSWWEQRDNPNVLLLCYEDALADPVRTIERVASLMNVELDQELLATVLRLSSREYMLQHKERFDERHLRGLTRDLANLEPGEASKVQPRTGEGNCDRSRHELPRSLKDELDEIWREQVAGKHGLESYEQLRASLP